jgi:serine/threonine protein kinase
MLICLQAFARKVFRVQGSIKKEDVDHEARVMSTLHEGGGHQHIVGILSHGWFKNPSGWYFLDMELCDLNLEQYIEYHWKSESSFDISQLPSIDSIFVTETGPNLPEWFHNVWTIGLHLALGLEYMHAKKIVHRDLKPSNGTFPQHITAAYRSTLLLQKQGLENCRFWILHRRFI